MDFMAEGAFMGAEATMEVKGLISTEASDWAWVLALAIPTVITVIPTDTATPTVIIPLMLTILIMLILRIRDTTRDLPILTRKLPLRRTIIHRITIRRTTITGITTTITAIRLRIIIITIITTIMAAIPIRSPTGRARIIIFTLHPIPLRRPTAIRMPPPTGHGSRRIGRTPMTVGSGSMVTGRVPTIDMTEILI